MAENIPELIPYEAINFEDGVEVHTDLPAQLQRMENQIASLTDHQIETCDSLSQSVRISVTASEIALKPNGAEVFSIDITETLEDYRVIGIVGFDSYSADAVITRCILYENAVSGRVRNLISGAHTVRPTVNILCIPTTI